MKQQLYSMLSELSEYHRDKVQLMKIYIQDRLENSFNVYTKELQQSLEFLTSKHEKSLLKRMNKIK